MEVDGHAGVVARRHHLHRLFNSSLEGNVRRAIDIHEGETVDASALKTLIRQAIAVNSAGKSKPPKKKHVVKDATA